MIQWKLGCRSRKQKQKNQPIAKSGIEHCHWFILPLLLATPTMQFSLDRKQRRHKQNQCSASDSVGLIFTRSYRSTLLITTPTTTPSLVKTSLLRWKCRDSWLSIQARFVAKKQLETKCYWNWTRLYYRGNTSSKMLPRQDECRPRFYLGKDEIECENTASTTRGGPAVRTRQLSGGTVRYRCIFIVRTPSQFSMFSRSLRKQNLSNLCPYNINIHNTGSKLCSMCFFA